MISARTVAAQLALLVLVATANPAVANDIGIAASNELRLGYLQQNVEGTGTEFGNDINIEYLVASPFFAADHGAWAALLAPRPHVGATINLDGSTNRVYAGLTWDFPLGRNFFGEIALGGTVHDGPLVDDKLDSFGCRANFREALSLGYHISDRVSLMVIVDHMSNAKLCERNRGLTSAGVRLGYALN